MNSRFQNVRMTLLAAAVAAATLAAGAGAASAQGLFGALFDNGPSGRNVVNFATSERAGTIIVSIGDRRLYKLLPGGKAISYPIAIPEGKAFWSGVEPVTRKAVNPRWTPTASMRRENPALPAYVPGGDPRNPLGVRALYLGNTLYRIHGTDAPWLIGRSVSKGCIRMHNDDVIDLYNRTSIGTKVIVTGKSYASATTFAQDSNHDWNAFPAR